MRLYLVLVTAILCLPLTACSGRTTAPAVAEAAPSPPMSELWTDPGGSARDLFWGVGGKELAPPPDAAYTFKGKDDTGFSVSYDVIGPDGTEWSAKIGPEAQAEVVVSRILWGLGFHQPPVYYLPSWQLAGDAPEGRKESEARFRPKLARLERLEEFWKWQENPFTGSRELKGLLVVLLMLNSTDLKDDNNSIYELPEPWDGASRWFVVRDVGAALGETGKLFPRRNWIDGFEKERFITSIAGERLEFDYDGRHDELLTLLGPDDVRWAARLMGRLTDAQWRDAFRAANYAEPIAARYIRRIRQKIEDGVAVRVDTTVTEDR